MILTEESSSGDDSKSSRRSARKREVKSLPVKNNGATSKAPIATVKEDLKIDQILKEPMEVDDMEVNDEKKALILQLQMQLRNEEMSLLLMKKIRQSQVLAEQAKEAAAKVPFKYYVSKQGWWVG